MKANFIFPRPRSPISPEWKALYEKIRGKSTFEQSNETFNGFEVTDIILKEPMRNEAD